MGCTVWGRQVMQSGRPSHRKGTALGSGEEPADESELASTTTRAHMAAMAARVPAIKLGSARPPQARFTSSPRVSAPSRCGRHGHGSGGAFSGVWCRGGPVRSDSASARVKFCSDLEQQLSGDDVCSSTASELRCTGSAHWFSCCGEPPSGSNARHGHTRAVRRAFRCNCASRENQDAAGNEDSTKDTDEDSPSGGVAIAVKILQFYKREISPLLPGSCRFVPTCSEYGMQAFKKYGVVKGAILTAWRLSRCNPLGGSGFDPPRWFDEPRPPPY